MNRNAFTERAIDEYSDMVLRLAFSYLYAERRAHEEIQESEVMQL